LLMPGNASSTSWARLAMYCLGAVVAVELLQTAVGWNRPIVPVLSGTSQQSANFVPRACPPPTPPLICPPPPPCPYSPPPPPTQPSPAPLQPQSRVVGFWEQRYAAGGNSGAGSYDEYANFKARFLNAFVEKNSVRRVIEFGHGDGNQLALARYPEYVGVDVSKTIVRKVSEKFRADTSKRFVVSTDYRRTDFAPFDLAMSLDVIYHLVDDGIFDHYMRRLFAASNRFVIIFATDRKSDEPFSVSKWKHVRHRAVTAAVKKFAPGWQQVEYVPPLKASTPENEAAFFVLLHPSVSPATYTPVNSAGGTG